MIQRIFCILLFTFLTTNILAQSGDDSLRITVGGHAYDVANPSDILSDLMIINLRTSHGSFGKSDGTFTIHVLRTDTIVVASTGYVFERFCFADSTYRESYYVEVPLLKLLVKLPEVSIFAPRDLESIYGDIKKLGYNKRDFELSGVNAISSPITFLYQEFSQLEKVKRHNRERINEQKGRELLKQLLANYVAADIINLDNIEFDDFIDFANVSESYMKSASQYDFCMYIKHRFEIYAMMKRRR